MQKPGDKHTRVALLQRTRGGENTEDDMNANVTFQ